MMACRKAFDWETMNKEVNTKTFWRDILAEFVSTFLLMSLVCVLPLTWGRDTGFSHAAITGLGVGFVVATIVWSLGDFGGAHMNPAVTFAMLLSLKISVIKGFLFILVQIAGATAGAGFASIITPREYHDTLAATCLGPNVTPLQGYLTETWITFILVITVFGSINTARKENGAPVTPIYIGLAVALGIFGGWNHTGGSMNPARSFGPALIKWIWKDHWIYWAGPLSGGALAAVSYLLVFDRVDRPRPRDILPTILDKREKEYIGYRLARQDNMNCACVPLVMETRT